MVVFVARLLSHYTKFVVMIVCTFTDEYNNYFELMLSVHNVIANVLNCAYTVPNGEC